MRGIQRTDARGLATFADRLPGLVPGPHGAHPRQGARRRERRAHRPALLQRHGDRHGLPKARRTRAARTARPATRRLRSTRTAASRCSRSSASGTRLRRLDHDGRPPQLNAPGPGSGRARRALVHRRPGRVQAARRRPVRAPGRLRDRPAGAGAEGVRRAVRAQAACRTLDPRKLATLDLAPLFARAARDPPLPERDGGTGARPGRDRRRGLRRRRVADLGARRRTAPT